MYNIIWDSVYTVGEPTIDGHHKKLVTIINSLGKVAEESSSTVPDETFHILLDELMKYVRTHFAYEEEVFSQTSYNKKDEHRDYHFSFVETLAEKCIDASSGYADRDQLHKFLVNWLKHHILVEDMEYKKYLNQQVTKEESFG